MNNRNSMKKILTLALFLSLAALLPAQAQKSVLRSSLTYEKMQANGVRLPVIGELVTQAPDINKQYWWSVGCETLDRDFADFDKFKDFFVELGIGYARLQSGWAKTEKEKGKYDFAWLDHIVDGLIERGVKPWMCLCYSNPLYGGGTVHLGSSIFTEEETVKAKGKAHLLDKLTYHSYFPCPESSVAPVRELEATVQAIAPQVRLLQGESGCPSQYEFGCAMKYLEWTEYSQAKWNLRRMLTDFSMGLPASIFSMVDVQYKNYMLLSYGLLRCDLAGKVRYARPSFYAVRNLASIVTADFHPSDAFTISYRGEERISSVGLSKDGKTVGVFLWFSDDVPSDCQERKEVDVSSDGIDLANTAYVDPVTGKVYELRSCLFDGDRTQGHTRYHNLPLWDCPVLIINRSYLNMKK